MTQIPFALTELYFLKISFHGSGYPQNIDIFQGMNFINDEFFQNFKHFIKEEAVARYISIRKWCHKTPKNALPQF